MEVTLKRTNPLPCICKWLNTFSSGKDEKLGALAFSLILTLVGCQKKGYVDSGCHGQPFVCLEGKWWVDINRCYKSPGREGLFVVQCTREKTNLIFSVRGVYLASLLFTDDEKLLVTVDENIPIIEVDDNHPSTFLQDFCWLMKVQTSRKQTSISCCPCGLLFCPMLVTWCLAF